MAGIGALILLGLVGLWIAENPVPVPVVVLGTALPPLPLGIWMTIAFGVGAGLGAIARWVWPPVAQHRAEPIPVTPRREVKAPEPPAEDEKDDWLEDLAAEPRNRSPSVKVAPPTEEDEAEDEDDEDTYLIARYIRR